MKDERLFIKVILQNQAKVEKKQGRGGEPKPFKEVTGAVRKSLVSKVDEIHGQFKLLPQQIDALPAKITLVEKAAAKSHTPTLLFNEQTWSIIGKGNPTELFVKVTKKGTEELKRKITTGFSKEAEKAISTIAEIEPITAESRLPGINAQQLFEMSPKRADRSLIKVKLFNYEDPDEQEQNHILFEQTLLQNGIEFKKLDTYEQQHVYQVSCKNSNEISQISETVMVRSITSTPVVKILREQNFNERPIPSTMKEPQSTESYPIVAVVDTGVNSSVSKLEAWVVAREKFVAKNEENTYHGTFVAGLIVWGKQLNPSLKEVDDSYCKILDIHVLPNNNPAHGKVGILTEDELIQDLEDLLLKYSDKVKVWNLSLGTDEICDVSKFSDFAIQLDELQEKFNVSFVIAAGNCSISSLLSYPRTEADMQKGRIAAPADSVLGITVGAVSQIDHPSTGAKYGDPSPFSRNGPGPNYIIKPDFAHYGGNIGIDASYPLGITSISSETTVGDNIGTSFAAPLISRKLAHIYHEVVPSPSSILARALLTHSARDLRTMNRVVDEDNLYLGFGTPTNIDSALQCSPWFTTLVFEESLREGYELQWDNFPFPESLISNGKFRGEIWMTLAYHPKRNPNFGSEYCETHVDASFGVMKDFYDGDKEEIKEIFEGQVPQEHLKANQLFESIQVKRLRKWSPVRTYHRRIDRGIDGKRWKLRVNMISRHRYKRISIDEQGTLFPTAYLQNFALIVTIADPDRQAPIYDEMARILRTRFQSRNLQIRPSIKIRT